jgi:hypothetical protein
MKFLKNFFTFLAVIFFSFSLQATRIDLSGDDPLCAPRNVVLNAGSLEEDLRTTYSRIIQPLNLNDFRTRCNDFKDSIFFPINMNNILNQQSYIDEIIDIHDKIENNTGFLKSFFKKNLADLEQRIDLAKIDQQLITQDGHRGNFIFQHIGVNYRNPLTTLVGKIFHITQEKEEDPEVNDVGSAMLASFNQNLPLNMAANKDYSLNGVITCSHVLEASEDEHILGVYFVSNQFIDADIGLPLTTTNGNNIINSDDLISFLQTDPRSFLINTYTIKNKVNEDPYFIGMPITETFIGSGKKSFLGNNINTTKPQYWDNEDIAFGYFKNQEIPYRDNNISVCFDSIRKNQALAFNNGDRYFAIGYPGCDHYDTDANTYNTNNLLFNKITNTQALIDELGISPLFITSDTVVIGWNNNAPVFNNGIITHSAITAKGMSGGPLIKIENNQINVFGVITSGDINEQEGCY